MPLIDHDGVRLFFEEAGGGRPPLLLVHGWTCDHSFFAPQFEHFRRRHRVVAVDLRGHGRSDKPQQHYSMTAFADDLVWLCGQLGLERPVVIGHSMGGVIALELSSRYPQLPAAIVSVDSPIPPLAAARESMAAIAAMLRTPEYREAQRQFVSSMLFLPSDDAQRKARIVDLMSSAPQHVMASAFEHIASYDYTSAATSCRVPWLALSAHPPFVDLAHLRALCPHVLTGQTVGAGHFNQLEVPEQVNAMIERFLAVAVTAGAVAA